MLVSDSPIAIDLFSGAGGLSEGLLASGINVAVAVEAHPDPALTHAFNHPDTTVLCADLRKLSLSDIRAHVRNRTGQSRVDIVVGGPPCQGFSTAGLQNGRDPRNRLFEQFLRAVEFFRPRMFLFENVPGLELIGGGRVARAILDGFWNLGYEMHGVDNESDYYPDQCPTLNAAQYGVPQYRTRLMLVGWRRGALDRPFSWPRPKHASDCVKPGVGRHHVSVADAIGDLAYLSAGEECHNYVLKPVSRYQEQRRIGSRLLLNHLATKHRKPTVDMFRRLAPGKTINSIPDAFRSGKQRMRRFKAQDPSWAVLALPDDYVHYQRHRIPTVREMARLQSFDDDFVFLGKRTTSAMSRRIDVPQYTQVGNAVPPLLAKAIGTAMNRSLGGTKRDLRGRPERRARFRWLRGSSGYLGYTLDPSARGELALFDVSGALLDLPLCNEESPISSTGKPADWTKRALKRRAQLRET